MNPMYDLVVIALIVVGVMSNLYFSRYSKTEQTVSTRTKSERLSRRALQIEDAVGNA